VDSGKLLALSLLWKGLPKRPNPPHEGPKAMYKQAHSWALERLGLDYRYRRFGMKNRVKEPSDTLMRISIFHHT